MSWLLYTFACTTEPACVADLVVYEDLDGDGYGTVELERVCDLAEGMALEPRDCDDADPAVNPLNEESCNGLDDDCDGEVDDGFDRKSWFRDEDGDSFGRQYPSVLACERPDDGWVTNQTDCDDDDDRVSPDAQETCDRGDEDCDGLQDDYDDSVDRQTFETWFRDSDGDAYGDEDETTRACRPPSGFVPNDEDCDDRDATFTRNTYWRDDDDDGFGDPNRTVSACTRPANAVSNADDCDDSDPAITNEHDWYVDTDSDGWGAGASLGFSCNPPDPDAVGAAGDCAPSDPDESPDTLEDCVDGVDQNCNGLVDCSDTDCVGDPTCVPPCADDQLVGNLPFTVNGNTTGRGNNETGTCGGSGAPDWVYQWIPQVSGQVVIDTIGSAYDTVLYVRDGCGGVQLACNDDAIALQSRVNVSVTAGEPVIIVVDGYSANAGAFTLNLQ